MTISCRIKRPNRIFAVDNELAIIDVMQFNGRTVEFLIDSVDLPAVSLYKWFSHNGYCCTIKYGRQWHLTWELFWRPPKGYILHHMNGDRRDNRRSNICLVPHGVNNYFKEVQENRSTGRRGISIYADGSIVALIGTRGKRKSFKTIEQAIEARERFEKIMNNAMIPPRRHRLFKSVVL